MADKSFEDDELRKLRAAAQSQLSKADTPDRVESAGRILSQVAEIEKTIAQTEVARFERQKFELDSSAEIQRARTEERKNLITALAPLLTTLVLAGTVVLQTYQAIKLEHNKQVEPQRQRDADEDLRWAETLKSLSAEIKGISPGSLNLTRFFASARYGEIAKQTALGVLSQTKDFNQFREMFSATFGPVTWDNLASVLDLDRQLAINNRDVLSKPIDSITTFG